jgi:hypothetical protein
LRRRAKDFEAVLVLGCASAKHSVQAALKDTECQIMQGMQMTGITNASVKFRFPLTLTLEETALVGESERRGKEV